MARAIPLLLTLITLAGGSPEAAADLARIDRGIGKEPKYQSRPLYCLLALGPEAKHKAWLVLDGDVLYVDRHGSGDLTRPECRVAKTADPYCERLFEAGDLTVGGRTYTGLRVGVDPAQRAGGAAAEMPMFRAFLAAHPDGKLYSVSVEVPFARPFPDLRDGSPLTKTRHSAAEYDAAGVLQFAGRREEAPVIHFGGPWILWPDGQQKLVRGRAEDLVLRLGTSGRGPGTFACICYDNLVPEAAKPHVRVEYPAAAGAKPTARNYVLEDRC